MPESEARVSNVATEITVAVVLLLVAFGFFGAYLNRIIEWYQRILDWIYTQDWDYIVFMITVIFSLLSAFLLGFAIWSARKFFRLRRAPRPQPETFTHAVSPKEEIKESWNGIQQLMDAPTSSEWNMAILRADALLDDVLIHQRYEGETLAERLKIVSPTILPSIERLWAAHRLRNLIAHEPLRQHPKETLLDALNAYRQAFVELGMLEQSPVEPDKKTTAPA